MAKLPGGSLQRRSSAQQTHGGWSSRKKTALVEDLGEGYAQCENLKDNCKTLFSTSSKSRGIEDILAVMGACKYKGLGETVPGSTEFGWLPNLDREKQQHPHKPQSRFVVKKSCSHIIIIWIHGKLSKVSA